MRIQDFGRFDEAVTLFGGPYSNIQALNALVDAQNGQPAICTGDVVAYCADAAVCVDMCMELLWPLVAGNCERQIADGAADCGCGFVEDTACDRLSRTWYPFAQNAMTPAHRAWMARLPDIGTFQQGARRYAVIHGGITDIARFLWPSSEASDFEVELTAIEQTVGPVDGVVAGHSGIPFHRWIGRHHWINTGVIGLPPNDGRPETRYAVLNEGDVVFHHLSYDHTRARQSMEAAGLTQGYHAALDTGLWPSEEVLPQTLRR